MPAIELIVRGVLIKDGSILLARQKGDMHAFLPGGHIEFGESIESALAREIKEELGVSVHISHLIGVAEHSWQEVDGHHQELNLIFYLNCDSLSSGIKPASLESHLEFIWQPLDKLNQVNLRPHILSDLLPKWIKDESKSQWCSTFKREERHGD